ncbi:MAG: WYL domain-containing protein, partial [Oscillospiraceae bacterium]|nr:WYL domain-containing protein [Oscillospiraceae bacterium]
RSIYKDIEEINKATWMLENGGTLQEAEEAIEDEKERLVVFDRHRKEKGFYVRQRRYDLTDIRLLAECVYSAKFIPQGQADRLASIVSDFVSKHQAEKIRNSALVLDRVKTLNHGVLNNISRINEAMATTLDGQPHEPQKISFNYLTHEIGNLDKPVERRTKYVVSPYYLVIDAGNYYLLAFDDKAQDKRTFRVDRMKKVDFVAEPREGAEAFSKLDAENFMQRVFSMYSGERKRVKMRFINRLLDTVIDRFGRRGVIYEKADASHFYVTADVEISDQFFAWVCGFGNRVRIETPDVAAAYAAYLDKIRKMY